MTDKQMLTDLFKQSQRFDPLDFAEKITGQQANTDNPETLGLGFAAAQAQMALKHKILTELGDTHYHISWSDFLDVIQAYGFEIVIRRNFDDSYGKQPEQIVAAHPDKYLLLMATSNIGSGDASLNGGTVYGMLDFSQVDDQDLAYSQLPSIGGGPLRDNKFPFNYDVREGMITTLTQLEAITPFRSWNHPNGFLWLNDYSPQEKKGGNWREIRDQRLMEAPEWVRQFINS